MRRREIATIVLTSLVSAFLAAACDGNHPAAGAEPTARTTPSAGANTRTTGHEVLTGDAAKGDWTSDAPGVRRKLTTRDLPAPYATDSARNQPQKVAAPEGALPKVPPGFQVDAFVSGLSGPRMIRTAPNGDIFVAESVSNRVRVLHDANRDGKADLNEIFANDLTKPFGIAFYPPGDNPTHVYIANTGSVVRYAYSTGDTKARGPSETIVADLSSGGQLEGGGHWTRDIAFSRDGSKLYVSIGSMSNDSDDEIENRRARIFEYTPDGKNERVYASGIRNPVGLAIHPTSGDIWASVNERDELGDHLVPDYITRVRDGGFYGWPWYYLGGNQDPRHEGKHPELKDSVLVPDVLLQSHSASLGMAFYTADQFPPEFRDRAFAAQHGSWNRAHRTGYKVISLPMDGTAPTGEYEDFMTGFVKSDREVWGRPVAVTVGRDGALYVSDDAANVIWRVTYATPRH
jgi:glucose/arabinose dehydrogenase